MEPDNVCNTLNLILSAITDEYSVVRLWAKFSFESVYLALAEVLNDCQLQS